MFRISRSGAYAKASALPPKPFLTEFLIRNAGFGGLAILSFGYFSMVSKQQTWQNRVADRYINPSLPHS